MPNLKNSCRICMKVLKKDETHSIFTIKIKEMLNCCTTIQFENNDNFPSNLCNNCLKQLKIAFEFRKKAEESNENFQKLIEDNFNSNQDYTDESDVDFKILINDEFNCSENSDNDDKSHIWKRGEESNERLVKIVENDDFNCNVNKEDISESNENFKILIKDEFNYEHDISKKGEQDYENFDDFNCNVNNEDDISESNEHFKVLIKDEFNYDYDISDDKTYISREAEENNETKKLINNDESYVCEQCNQKFPSKFLLILHKKLCHSNKPERTSCDFCDKQYKHFKNFKLHLMKKHFKVKPHSCHLCQKSFSYPHDLRNHEKSHSDLKPFKCPQCEKSFIEEFQLKQHQLNFHKSRRWFECTDCGLRFNTNGSLKSHLRIHTTLKSSHHKVTERDSAFQEHKKLRTDEQNCICSICGISTTTIPILKRHLWTHTGEKPYRCNVPHCGKAYTRNEHLKRHTQITHS